MNESELELELIKLVKVYRNKKKFSLEALASITGLNASYLGKLEKGLHSTTLCTYFLLAKAVDVPVPELMNQINRYFKL